MSLVAGFPTVCWKLPVTEMDGYFSFQKKKKNKQTNNNFYGKALRAAVAQRVPLLVTAIANALKLNVY